MWLERSPGWRWLKNGFLKKETEGLILAAQEQAARTNSVKHSMDKTGDTPMHVQLDRGVNPPKQYGILSECRKLVQREYRKRHDKVALQVYRELCRKYGLE